MKYIINITIGLIFLISLASANGLHIDNNQIEINKTNNVDEYFNFDISNQETFKFFNISSQNSIIEFDKFNLDSGETKNIQVKITSNLDFDGEIKIIGEYFTNLGSSNETETVTIDSTGVDICNLDLIQGDTIIWNNTLLGSTMLKNVDSGEYFHTIQGSDIYESNFIESQEFNYQVFKTGLPYSNICHINIRPESGYIHSSEYDSEINLDIKINYEPTTISTNFFTDSYSLSYNSEKEDIYQIVNTGNKVAKNIKLSGDWFTFNSNNFDLGIGESKNIGYKIKPIILQTEDTNKTHNKKIIIEGNFEKIEKEINIFISYKDISGSFTNSSYDKEYLKNVVNLFCSIYPEDCPETIIFGDETDQNVTFIVGKDAYLQSTLEEDRFREEIRSILGTQNEKLALLENETEKYSNQSNETFWELEKIGNSTDGVLGTVLFLGIIFLILLITGLSAFIYFNSKAQIKLRKLFNRDERW